MDWFPVFQRKNRLETNWKKSQYQKHTLDGHQGWVRALDLHEDYLYSGSNDTTVR